MRCYYWDSNIQIFDYSRVLSQWWYYLKFFVKISTLVPNVEIGISVLVHLTKLTWVFRKYSASVVTFIPRWEWKGFYCMSTESRWNFSRNFLKICWLKSVLHFEYSNIWVFASTYTTVTVLWNCLKFFVANTMKISILLPQVKIKVNVFVCISKLTRVFVKYSASVVTLILCQWWNGFCCMSTERWWNFL